MVGAAAQKGRKADEGAKATEIDLLHSITGAFRPGVLTALMATGACSCCACVTLDVPWYACLCLQLADGTAAQACYSLWRKALQQTCDCICKTLLQWATHCPTVLTFACRAPREQAKPLCEVALSSHAVCLGRLVRQMHCRQSWMWLILMLCKCRMDVVCCRKTSEATIVCMFFWLLLCRACVHSHEGCNPLPQPSPSRNLLGPLQGTSDVMLSRWAA